MLKDWIHTLACLSHSLKTFQPSIRSSARQIHRLSSWSLGSAWAGRGAHRGEQDKSEEGTALKSIHTAWINTLAEMTTDIVGGELCVSWKVREAALYQVMFVLSLKSDPVAISKSRVSQIYLFSFLMHTTILKRTPHGRSYRYFCQGNFWTPLNPINLINYIWCQITQSLALLI